MILFSVIWSRYVNPKHVTLYMYTWVDSEQETSVDKTTDTHIEEEWRQQTLLEEENRLKQLNI